ncbi:MAG: hypothetical protein AB8F94_11080 [Saprospiraceae bacterium]
MSSLLVLKFILMAIFSAAVLKVWSVIEGLWEGREFEVNDYVQFEGELARVKEVGLKNLLLEVNQNSELILPLKKIEQLGITNLSKTNTPIKGHVAFKACSKININKIEDILIGIMKEHIHITNSTKPYVSTVGLRNENIVFHLYFYSFGFSKMKQIERDLKMKILDAFAEREITHLFREPDSMVKVKAYVSNN